MAAARSGRPFPFAAPLPKAPSSASRARHASREGEGITKHPAPLWRARSAYGGRFTVLQVASGNGTTCRYSYRNLELDSTRRAPSLITLRFASTRGTRVHPELLSHFTVRVTRSTVGSTRIAVTVRGASARAVAGTAVGCGGLATVCSHSDRCPRHPLVCQGGANLLPSKHCPPSSECQTERDHRGRLPGTPR